MIYLLDTNAISDLMNAHAKTEARLNSLSGQDRAGTSPIVIGEIHFGIRKLAAGKRRTDLALRASNVMASLSVIDVTDAVGDRYASLKVNQQQMGMNLDENDLWIAATALVHGATVVTRDQDFSRVTGLAVADWSV